MTYLQKRFFLSKIKKTYPQPISVDFMLYTDTYPHYPQVYSHFCVYGLVDFFVYISVYII